MCASFETVYADMSWNFPIFKKVLKTIDPPNCSIALRRRTYLEEVRQQIRIFIDTYLYKHLCTYAYACYIYRFFLGFVHALWRQYAMPRNSIFLLENQKNARKTSKLELEWLSWLETKLNCKIRTQFNHPRGQKRVDKYFLDGYLDDERKAFEFLGCQ